MAVFGLWEKQQSELDSLLPSLPWGRAVNRQITQLLTLASLAPLRKWTNNSLLISHRRKREIATCPLVYHSPLLQNETDHFPVLWFMCAGVLPHTLGDWLHSFWWMTQTSLLKKHLKTVEEMTILGQPGETVFPDLFPDFKGARRRTVDESLGASVVSKTNRCRRHNVPLILTLWSSVRYCRLTTQSGTCEVVAEVTQGGNFTFH